MADSVHQRHKPPTPLDQPRELIVACAAMRSNVNLSRIARAAGCCGVRRMICCGTAKLIGKIVRDALADDEARSAARDNQTTCDAEPAPPALLQVETHRTLAGVLKQLKQQGYVLVGLEQATGSECLHTFAFPRRSVLVVGNERTGLDDEELRLVDHVVEIPVWGSPHSYNVATAASMALYEYCRQWPRG
jgi:tRNA(Leu) C34 or U34 (ribose-2'-O)-methylase TrmL